MKKPIAVYIKLWLIVLLSSLASSSLQAQTNNQIRYLSEEKNQSLKVEYDGTITFGPDDRTIQSISDGGYLRIEKTTFGNAREVFITNAGNRLNYEYKEGGRVKPFEPDGRSWLADMVPELLRSTTIAAESRVDRLYRQGGVRQVIQELPELKGDHVKAKYIELLLAKNASANETNQIISAMGEHIKSDHYRYEIFKKNMETLFSNPTNQSQYMKTVQMIESDHYKSQLLKEVVKKQPPKAQQQQVIDLISTINSDHYKYEIIKDLTKQPLSDKELKSLLDKSIAPISSDHYRHELLLTILKDQKPVESQLMLLIQSADLLKSDHYKTEFLKKICKDHNSEKVKSAIRESAKNIKSSHYFGEIMKCANS